MPLRFIRNHPVGGTGKSKTTLSIARSKKREEFSIKKIRIGKNMVSTFWKTNPRKIIRNGLRGVGGMTNRRTTYKKKKGGEEKKPWNIL